jgi:transposase
MAMPEATPIRVTDREKQILEKYVRKGKAQARLKTRAEIILLAAEGAGNNQIGRHLKKNNFTVRKWRDRWAESYDDLQTFANGCDGGVSDSELEKRMLQILTDAPRPGTPPVITEEEKQRIRVMACQKPEEYGYPHAQWSHRLLAKAIVEEKILDEISPVYVGIILKKMTSDPTKPNTGSTRK